MLSLFRRLRMLCDLSPQQRGVVLSVSGFDDRLPAFIDTVANAIVNYIPTGVLMFFILSRLHLTG